MEGTKTRTARATTARRAVAIVGATALIAGAGGVLLSTAAQADTTVTEGTFDWGFRASFRTYVGSQTGAIPPLGAAPAGQRITVTAPATFNSAGTPSVVGNNETLPYTFPVSGQNVTSTTNLNVQADGGVVYNFPSHTFRIGVDNPSIVVNGATKQIEADLTLTPIDASGNAGTPTTTTNVPVADIANVNTTIAGDAKSATIAGTGLTLTAAGAAALNGYLTAGAAMDDFTAAVVLDDPAGPAVPTVQVSKTVANPAGDTITVTGTGFDPASSLGTRPPLSGVASGTYVVFGKFAPVWKPSLGTAAAPSSGRKVLSQKWAVPAASMATIGGPAAGAIELNPDGSFTATVDVKRDFTPSSGVLPNPGNYGVYTYAGSGGTNAAFETYTPITFTAATASTNAPAALEPGDTVSVSGTGFNANETVNVVLHSTPTQIGTLTADATGAVSGNVTIPNGTDEGAHSLHLVGAVSGVDVTAGSFTVSADLLDNASFQTITTTVIDQGALTVSVADKDVTLASPVLNGNATALVTTGALNPITVTDTRTADPGWTLSGSLSDFSGTAGTFDGDLLDFAPVVTDAQLPGGGATNTFVAAAAGGTGYEAGKPLASAPASNGRGTAIIGANLVLTIPTTTDPGVYSALLTLTAI